MKLLIHIIFFSISFSLSAQSFEWACQLGTPCCSDVGEGIAKDKSGNLYVTGHITSGTIFLAKYNPSGTLLWNKSILGGAAEAIAADSSGIYITGWYGATCTFGTITLTGSGVFIAKYDPSGICIWARKGTDGTISSIFINKDGTLNIAGNFVKRMCLRGNGDSIVVNGFSVDAQSMFIAKYSSNGDILWLKMAGGAPCPDCGHPYNSINGPVFLANDSSLNSYVVGYFTLSAIFGNDTITSPDADIFLAKYDKEGNFQWIKIYGGNNSEIPSAIALDHSGNVFLTGHFNTTTTFGSTTLSSSNIDLFLTKIDNSGNVLWSEAGQITLGGSADALYLKPNGNIILTGGFKGNMTLGSLTTVNSANGDVFIAELNSSGIGIWSIKSNDLVSYGKGGGRGIITDTSGNCYVTGFYDGTVAFGDSTFTGSMGNVFITKVNPSSTVGIKETLFTSGLVISPNPSEGYIIFDYKCSSEIKAMALAVRNVQGQLIYQKNYNVLNGEIRETVDISDRGKGIYFIEIMTDKERVVSKVVIE